MEALSIRLLGPVQIWRRGEPVELRRQKTRALLARLAVGERPPTREQVTALLWPESDQAHASGSLRTVLSELRRALPQGALEVSPGGPICLDLPEGACDVGRIDALERALAAGRADLGVAEERIQAFGTLCDGLEVRDAAEFEDWLLVERQRWEARKRGLQARLWRAQVDRKLYDAAVRTAGAMTEADPLSEPGYRNLIEAHLHRGDRSAAQTAYDRLAALFADEFGHAPSEETRSLLSEGPPATTSERTTLPRPLATLVGRGGDVEALRNAVRKSRLITLTGVGGVGKTRVAVELAHRLRDDGARLYFCELSPVREAQTVAHTIAAAIGATPSGASAEDVIVAALGDDPVVLLLDNCEHVLDPLAPLVARLLERCPEMAIVATSRERLRLDGEQVWPIDPLQRDDAVALFVSRARHADPRFDASDAGGIAELCERLDHLPLAIELAAARVRAYSPGQLLERLDDRFELLKREGAGGADRHEALFSTVAWSYDLLTEEERELFDRLSVFAGSFDVASAEAACADDPAAARRIGTVLAGLVDKSMVVPDRSGAFARYRLLETMRDFADRDGRRSKRTPRVGSARAGYCRLAVLPFETLTSKDDEDEFLADGMTEDVIVLLSRLPGFHIVARTSTFGYKGRSQEIARIAEELGVRYVVQGSVRRSGERVRISAELVDAEAGTQLWSERFDRVIDDIFAVQDEVTQAIAARLVPQLTTAEASRAENAPPESLDAWAFYQRALTVRNRATAEGSTDDAQRLVLKAIELDPDFAPARSLLANLIATNVIYARSRDPKRDARRALEQSRWAGALAVDHPAVLHDRGVVTAILDDHIEGEALLLRSVELNPNNAHGWAILGYIAVRSFRFEEGIARVHRAIELSPRDPNAHIWDLYLATAHVAQAHWEDALLRAERATQRSPSLEVCWVYRAVALKELGRTEEARGAAWKYRELQPRADRNVIGDLLRRQGPSGDDVRADLVERFWPLFRHAQKPPEPVSGTAPLWGLRVD